MWEIIAGTVDQIQPTFAPFANKYTSNPTAVTTTFGFYNFMSISLLEILDKTEEHFDKNYFILICIYVIFGFLPLVFLRIMLSAVLLVVVLVLVALISQKVFEAVSRANLRRRGQNAEVWIYLRH